MLLEAPIQDHLLARCVLQRAHGTFQKWPEGFAGFSASIRCRQAEDVVTGDVYVLTGGRVETTLAREELRVWVEALLRAVSHSHTPRFFKDADGRFPITFEPGDDDSPGRQIRAHLGKDTWRTYRLDAKDPLRQQEDVEPARRTIVTYDGFVRTCPGRVLPTRMQTLEWDRATEALLATTDIEDVYRRLEHVWLPARRQATLEAGGSRRVLIIELEGHVLL
jgi:hypothetical protein